MKLDDRKDALQIADFLLEKKQGREDIADALLTAHLEGIEQARDHFLDRNRPDDISAQLDRRRDFLRSQIKNPM